MSTPGPNLPAELYREVLSNLNVARADERKTLLSLSLVSEHLRDESQRALFSSNEPIPQIALDNRDIIVRHHQFVQTIFNYPARFGMYVRTFVQVDLEYGSYTYRSFEFKGEMKMRERLWELTVKTLPHLICLKSLVISRSYAAGPAIFTSCDFQLEVVQYQSSSPNDILLSVVLPTQCGLLHLSLYSTSDSNRNSALLANDKYVPSLLSFEGEMPALGKLARTRRIIAFAVNSPSWLRHDDDKHLCKDALNRLKYLKLAGNINHEKYFGRLKILLDGAHLNIALLELDDCSRDLSKGPLAPLPELRLLSLRFPGSGFPKQPGRIAGAKKAFKQYPKLERVIFWDDEHSSKWIYSRLTRMDEENRHQQTGVRYWSEEVDEVDAPDWEVKLPAERMLGVMWWRQCYL